jgi:RNA polymerase sigma-70 factor (ECF subfamily)
MGNATDAEDVVQEALMAAFRNLHQFRGQAQMSTWLNTIVANCARMQLRRRPRHAYISLEEKFGDEEQYSVAERLSDRKPSPEDDCRTSELHQHMLQLVTQLPPPLRAAFQLRELDGLSTSETARVMGVAKGTVKSQLSRARARLRRAMRRALGLPSGSVLPYVSLRNAAGE